MAEGGTGEPGKVGELGGGGQTTRLARHQVRGHQAGGPGGLVEAEDVAKLVAQDRHQVHPVGGAVGGPTESAGVPVDADDVAHGHRERVTGKVVDEQDSHTREVHSEGVGPLALGGEESGVKECLSQFTTRRGAAGGSWLGRIWRKCRHGCREHRTGGARVGRHTGGGGPIAGGGGGAAGTGGRGDGGDRGPVGTGRR